MTSSTKDGWSQAKKIRDDLQIFLYQIEAPYPWESPIEGPIELNVMIIQVQNKEMKLESSKGAKGNKKNEKGQNRRRNLVEDVRRQNTITPVDSTSAHPSSTQISPLDNLFQLQDMQQEFKQIHEVLANLREKVDKQEENIRKLQSDDRMKTPSPIGRGIWIGERRGLIFDPYEVEESEEDSMVERTHGFQLPYGGRMSQSDNNDVINKGLVTRAQAKKIHDDVRVFLNEIEASDP
ncbi:hypothetical protein M9H77_18075 [Catharanthus roseus]|uniref:Uncharacterized protein n=1 Tax=Catharanthus roseus TaxID=4058 RepID=A0ACC0B6E0_CATRO|nr:hypothetical protein M9H77_18075 [Catharanthus roseus]